MIINDSLISTTRESLDNTMLIIKPKKNMQFKKFIEDTVLEDESGEEKISEDICDRTRLDWNEMKKYIAPDDCVEHDVDEKVEKADVTDEDVMDIIKDFIKN
jgi:hypothetical protein